MHQSQTTYCTSSFPSDLGPYLTSVASSFLHIYSVTTSPDLCTLTHDPPNHRFYKVLRVDLRDTVMMYSVLPTSQPLRRSSAVQPTSKHIGRVNAPPNNIKGTRCGIPSIVLMVTPPSLKTNNFFAPPPLVVLNHSVTRGKGVVTQKWSQLPRPLHSSTNPPHI
ncbi:unnamed protein product [Taenia asiatica]|uniref:Uncharacterized protein n=1 Tax=Taenia asiatica TaxID=60517 RepID=A0A0R3WFN9_TAEAS|nr:unnamed protein product [Taenia asiatica]